MYSCCMCAMHWWQYSSAALSVLFAAHAALSKGCGRSGTMRCAFAALLAMLPKNRCPAGLSGAFLELPLVPSGAAATPSGFAGHLGWMWRNK